VLWRDPFVAKGVLADVAPTALSIMGLPQPKEMKGLGLVVR
jgi:2,3-bisphosphoglycerate-independent phosphoglycerate mutase